MTPVWVTSDLGDNLDDFLGLRLLQSQDCLLPLNRAGPSMKPTEAVVHYCLPPPLLPFSFHFLSGKRKRRTEGKRKFEGRSAELAHWNGRSRDRHITK